MAEQDSLYRKITIVLYSPVDSRFGCVQVLVLMNETATNRNIQVIPWKYSLISLTHLARRGSKCFFYFQEFIKHDEADHDQELGGNLNIASDYKRKYMSVIQWQPKWCGLLGMGDMAAESPGVQEFNNLLFLSSCHELGQASCLLKPPQMNIWSFTEL